MNCANHGGTAAVAYCRTCGKPLCSVCTRSVGGVVYCETCLAEKVHGTAGPGATGTGMPGMPPPSSGAPPQSKPVLAGLLGFIPGVGAMYNGQFMKGVIHAMAFVVLVFLTTHFWVFGMVIGFFVFYMVFDAYKTAEAIQHGMPLPDPFGLEGMFGPGVNQATWQASPAVPSAANPAAGPGWTTVPGQGYTQPAVNPQACDNNSVPIGAVVLIGLGFLLLLDNLGWVTFGFHHLWPLILIAIGAWLIVKRWTRKVS